MSETRRADLVIRNGLVVTDEGRRSADVHVRGSTVARVGTGSEASGPPSTEIDATGCLVLPGGIDPHVHLTIPVLYTRFTGGRWADDFTSGSKAALAGGITTMGNIAFPKPSEGLLAAVERERALIEKHALADVMLHPVVGAPSWTSLFLSLIGIRWGTSLRVVTRELPALVRAGQPSIKVFMNFEQFDADYDGFVDVLQSAGQAGILTMFHCEDASTIEQATKRLRFEGRDSLRHFAESRPVEAEVRATRRAVAMCRETKAPIYVVHLSSARALRVCEEARDRGLPVYVETRPLYLHLTEERFQDADGQKYIGQPPLRTAEDVETLWGALSSGAVDTIATDHAPWTLDQKLDPSLTFERHRPGVNNLQVMLPMLFSEGVRKGRISLERFVAVTSTNAARLFGLYPRKGTIRVGSDADLVVWDPKKSKTIRRQDILSKAGFSIYEGTEVVGWPKVTLRRGEVVYCEDQVVGRPGTGKLIDRRPWSLS
jgi:dihydropyrimidinase